MREFVSLHREEAGSSCGIIFYSTRVRSRKIHLLGGMEKAWNSCLGTILRLCDSHFSEDEDEKSSWRVLAYHFHSCFLFSLYAYYAIMDELKRNWNENFLKEFFLSKQESISRTEH